MRRPSSQMLPPVSGSSPARQFSAVDLPQPEGPSRATNSPRATVSVTSRNAATLPNRRPTPSSRNSLKSRDASAIRFPSLPSLMPVREAGGNCARQCSDELLSWTGPAGSTAAVARLKHIGQGEETDMERIAVGGLGVVRTLLDFVNEEALPGTGLAAAAFWQRFGAMVAALAPRNRALMQTRDRMQAEIDAWFASRRGRPVDAAEQETFLRGIGYLVSEPASVAVTTEGVDPEIASIAGPQLVVPVNNARYALNAANARWGSLYDALYGTDAIPDADGAGRGKGYNPKRGAAVIARARQALDQAAPLAAGGHADATGYAIAAGALRVRLRDGGETGLRDPAQFVGYAGDAASPTAIVLRHHGLHLALHIDRAHPIGSGDPAGVADVVLEAAVTTIMDCEDSVAAVDADDKVAVYRNWLGLMKGTLVASFPKDGAHLRARG